MALERTIACWTSNSFACSSKITFTSLNHFSSYRLPNVSQLRFNCSLKCSVDYSGHQYNHAVDHPKPAEIPWNRELCNTVHLIGIVGTPVGIKNLPSGKVLAWTRFVVKKSTSETFSINLTFWDELAQVAFQHVEKGHQLYVSGRLISDTVESGDGRLQTYFKVAVQQLNFVERSSASSVLYDCDSNVTTAGIKPGNNTGNNMGSTLELWQAFFANPFEWRDYRKNKRNPKYPDFKHKDTREVLWVNGRYNPPWVMSQLAILDERMGSFEDQDDKMSLSTMAGDDLRLF